MLAHLLLGYLFLPLLFVLSTDYYELLGVKKDADDRTIRKAFKKLALSKHPDKDPDNPKAHDEFIKINRAYEVLKDPDTRRKYDLHGEKGLNDDNNAGNSYQSWDFYNDKFGIYDDDPEVVTLSRSDFQQQVTDSGDFWFINFYSTFCSHCHDLAPTWREFARKFTGIIRVGAVNCAEDPMLCQSQHVRGYPSLVAYPDHAFFQGSRTLDALSDFIISQMKVDIHHLTNRNLASLTQDWLPYAERPWIVSFCDDSERCLDKMDRKLLAHKLNGVVNVAIVTCESGNEDRLCENLRSSGLSFYPTGKVEKEHGKELNEFDIDEIYKEVIGLLDEVPELSDEEYRNLLDNIEEQKEVDQLVIFTNSEDKNKFTQEEYKKLPFLAGEVTVRVADCSKMVDKCDGLQLGKLPKTVLFRKTGHYLVSYGKKDTMVDTINFLKSSLKSTMISLTENLFDEIQGKQTQGDKNEIWLADFFAPWCHPCMLSLNELSTLPAEIERKNIRVGILDCDIFKRLCQEHSVNSYPTTMLILGETFSRLIGYHGQANVIEFIQEALHPSVVELNSESFLEFVVNKQANEIWVVDFFAPWCGPCQQLAPEFKKAARIMQDQNDQISFGTVDCQAHKELCQSNQIKNYPTVRVYRMEDGQAFDYPPNWWRDHRTMMRWFSQYLPSVVEELNDESMAIVMNEDVKVPWLLDFWAPWCGHCVQFAPVFEQAARMLEGQVKFGKVNCVDHPNACAHAAVNAYPTIKLYSQGRRNPAGGIRLHAQEANQLVDLVQRVIGQYGHSYHRDEL